MSRVIDVVRATGTHAARPAATAVPSGALYPCSDHDLIYRSDGATWATWATLTPTATADLSAHLADAADSHDASAVSFVPTGTIAATDVQAAIAEVAAEAGASAYTDEQARNAIGVALVQGSNITITVNDAADTITIAGTYADEQVDDRVGALVVDGSGIDAVYDDAGNLLTLQNGAVTISAQTGTAYTLVLADAPKFVTMTNAAASTLTVPPNSSVVFPVGTMIDGAQLGAGQVTLTPGAGVTINGTPGLKVAAQYGVFSLLKTATDAWLAFGRLAV